MVSTSGIEWHTSTPKNVLSSTPLNKTWNTYSSGLTTRRTEIQFLNVEILRKIFFCTLEHEIKNAYAFVRHYWKAMTTKEETLFLSLRVLYVRRNFQNAKHNNTLYSEKFDVYLLRRSTAHHTMITTCRVLFEVSWREISIKDCSCKPWRRLQVKTLCTGMGNYYNIILWSVWELYWPGQARPLLQVVTGSNRIDRTTTFDIIYNI